MSKKTTMYDNKLKMRIPVTKDTEYAVLEMDEYGDIQDTNCYETLAEAEAAFNELPGPAEIERWDNTWGRYADSRSEGDSLLDREITDIRSK